MPTLSSFHDHLAFDSPCITRLSWNLLLGMPSSPFLCCGLALVGAVPMARAAGDPTIRS